MKKVAIVSGANGQLGSYLVELLLGLGDYKVIGLYRRGSTDKMQNLKNAISKYPNELEMVSGDITDQGFIFHLMNTYRPQEVYNLAAQSFVHVSFTEPSYTFQVDTFGVLNFLEAIKQLKLDTRFITMSTSEMFGKSVSYMHNQGMGQQRFDTTDLQSVPEGSELFQDEQTPFCPQSPYGIAKLAGHHLVRLYREAYGMHCCSNINFNFESPRRGKEFVTRKITDYIGRLINRNAPAKLFLGNLDAKRDWGHAKDVADACYLSLQTKNPSTYVVSTMNTYTVRDFCEKAFGHVGLDYNDYVAVDPKFYRPAEVDYLLGDSSMIRAKLGWRNTRTFDELVTEMVDNDVQANI